MQNMPFQPPFTHCSSFGQTHFLLIQENHYLRKELINAQKEIQRLIKQYQALEEDFLHAIQCENGQACPNSALKTVHFASQNSKNQD